MKRLVEFPVGGGAPGETIVVEIEEPVPDAGVERAARKGDISERAGQSFDQAIDRIRPAAQATISKLASLPEAPDEIGVQFGIKLSAKVGAIIASTDAEANFTITLTWRRPQAGD